MDYNHIEKFLEKFKKIISQKKETKEIIIETISNEISYKIKENDISLKNGFIYIKGSPVIKNEILIKKRNILLKIKKSLPKSNFTDIK